MKLTSSLALVLFGLLHGIPASAQNARSDDAIASRGAVALPARPVGSSAVADLSALRSLLLLDAAFDSSPGTLDLSFTLRDPAQVSILLLDANGEPALPVSSAASFGRGEHHLTIDVDDLPAGTYLLRLSTSQGLAQRRITIAR